MACGNGGGGACCGGQTWADECIGVTQVEEVRVPTYEGYPDEQEEGEWIVDAAKAVVSWLGGLFGSEYPKDLPAPLSYSISQVAAMLERYPAVARELRAQIQQQGHAPCNWPVLPLTTSACGGTGPASPSRYDTLPELAALSLWYGNGTGDDLSRDEDTIRQLIVQGMGALSTGTTPAPSNDPDPIDILTATAASEGRAAAERLAQELAEGVYDQLPQSWQDAIERGLTDYHVGGAVRNNLGRGVALLVGGGILLALLRRAS